MKPILCSLCLLLCIGAAFHTRYHIVASAGGGQMPGAAYVLDRWTGHVRIASLLGNDTTAQWTATDQLSLELKSAESLLSGWFPWLAGALIGVILFLIGTIITRRLRPAK